MSATDAIDHSIRIIHSRRNTHIKPILERAGHVVKEGADVGGDVRVAWDPTNEVECRAVGVMFDALREAGYTAIKVGDDGTLADGQRIEKFDREIGRMVLLPKMQGGS